MSSADPKASNVSSGIIRARDQPNSNRLSMKSFPIFVISFLLCGSAVAQDFSTLLTRVGNAPESRRQFMVDSFLTLIGDFPHFENDSTVYLLYQGEAEDVSFAGDANGWDGKDSPFQRLFTTDLWYRMERYEPDARLDYKLIVDKQWMLDQRNPYTVSDGFGPNSELRMPTYHPPTEIIPKNTIPHGTLVDTTFSSSVLGNTRPVRIYLPPGYDKSGAAFPLVLFHDGMDYIMLGRAVNVLDNMIHAGRIPPLIAVFVPPVNRADEYAGGSIGNFAHFVSREVIPAIDRSYRTLQHPDSRAVIGSSNGGNIALYLAMEYPDVFGNIGAQSSNIIGEIFMRFRDGSKLPLRRIYMDLGTYDIPVLIALVRSFIPVLHSRGYEYRYREFHEGHSWGNWRARIDDMLEYFFGDLVNVTVPPPMSFRAIDIHGTAPNPAYSHTRLSFTLARSSSVRIMLHDVTGHTLRRFGRERLDAGDHHIQLNLTGIASGTYLVSVTSSFGAASTLLRIR